MKKNFNIFTLLSLILLGFSSAAFAVKTGELAPNFKLPGADGQSYELSQYKGKIVVLEWLNHGCPFVKKHYDAKAKNMQTLQAKYTKDKDVVWFSIISSAPSKQGHSTALEATAQAKEAGAKPTAILLDEKGETGKAYDAKTTPHMFVIDQAGKVAYQGAIDDKPSTDPADLAGATNYVVAAIGHLRDPKQAGNPVPTATTKPYGCSVKY